MNEITFGADVRIGNDDTFDLSLENAGARTGGVERVSVTFSAAPADSDFNHESLELATRRRLEDEPDAAALARYLGVLAAMRSQ